MFIETAMIAGFLLGLCFLLLVAGTHIVRYLQVVSISQQAIRLANSERDLPIGCFVGNANNAPYQPIIDRVGNLFTAYQLYSNGIRAPFYLRTAPTVLDVCHEFKPGNNSGPTQIRLSVSVPVEALFGSSGYVIGGVTIETTGPYLFEDT